MARVPFVAGNWKMNLTWGEGQALAAAIAKAAPQEVQVGVAPAFVHLFPVHEALRGSSVFLGAQDVYFQKNGAFTGEVSVDMLKDVGAKFCLTGHSERRHVIGESSELVAKKAAAVYSAGLVLVHCVGEKLDERDANRTLQVVQAQLDELTTSMQEPDRLVIAYEPVWAIGTGRVATDEQAQEVHAYIRQAIARKWNNDFANRVRIIYGGSMKPDNAKGLMAQPDVDGGLIGGAALKADSFMAIVNAAR